MSSVAASSVIRVPVSFVSRFQSTNEGIGFRRVFESTTETERRNPCVQLEGFRVDVIPLRSEFEEVFFLQSEIDEDQYANSKMSSIQDACTTSLEGNPACVVLISHRSKDKQEFLFGNNASQGILLVGATRLFAEVYSNLSSSNLPSGLMISCVGFSAESGTHFQVDVVDLLEDLQFGEFHHVPSSSVHGAESVIVSSLSSLETFFEKLNIVRKSRRFEGIVHIAIYMDGPGIGTLLIVDVEMNIPPSVRSSYRADSRPHRSFQRKKPLPASRSQFQDILDVNTGSSSEQTSPLLSLSWDAWSTVSDISNISEISQSFIADGSRLLQPKPCRRQILASSGIGFDSVPSPSASMIAKSAPLRSSTPSSVSSLSSRKRRQIATQQLSSSVKCNTGTAVICSILEYVASSGRLLAPWRRHPLAQCMRKHVESVVQAPSSSYICVLGFFADPQGGEVHPLDIKRLFIFLRYLREIPVLFAQREKKEEDRKAKRSKKKTPSLPGLQEQVAVPAEVLAYITKHGRAPPADVLTSLLQASRERREHENEMSMAIRGRRLHSPLSEVSELGPDLGVSLSPPRSTSPVISRNGSTTTSDYTALAADPFTPRDELASATAITISPGKSNSKQNLPRSPPRDPSLCGRTEASSCSSRSRSTSPVGSNSRSEGNWLELLRLASSTENRIRSLHTLIQRTDRNPPQSSSVSKAVSSSSVPQSRTRLSSWSSLSSHGFDASSLLSTVSSPRILFTPLTESVPPDSSGTSLPISEPLIESSDSSIDTLQRPSHLISSPRLPLSQRIRNALQQRNDESILTENDVSCEISNESLSSSSLSNLGHANDIQSIVRQVLGTSIASSL